MHVAFSLLLSSFQVLQIFGRLLFPFQLLWVLLVWLSLISILLFPPLFLISYRSRELVQLSF